MNRIKGLLTHNKKSMVRNALIVVLVVLFCLHIALNHRAASIVSFDLKGATTLFITQVAAAKLPQAQQKQVTQRFSKVLKQTLHDYAKVHSVTILVKGAVIEGQDITAYIEQQVANKMGAHHG